MSKKQKCLTGCDRPTFVRGLCKPCYAAFRSAVTAGRVTDQDAVDMGLVLPASPKTRPGPWVTRLKQKETDSE